MKEKERREITRQLAKLVRDNNRNHEQRIQDEQVGQFGEAGDQIFGMR